MKKFTIVEITDWEKDFQMMNGDSSHMPESDILSKCAEEYESKVENNEWPGLPFSCEAASEDEALDKYNETVCPYDYIRAIDADFA